MNISVDIFTTKQNLLEASNGSPPVVPSGFGTRSHSLHNTVNLPTAQEKNYVKNITVHSTPFLKQIHQSYRLWNAISTFDHSENSSIQFHNLVALTHILEECIQLETQCISNCKLQSNSDTSESHLNIIAQTFSFDAQEEIILKSHRKSFPSFTSQLYFPLLSPNRSNRNKNYFSVLLSENDPESTNMATDNKYMETDIDEPCASEPRSKTVSWSADTGVAFLSKDLFSHLQTYKEKVMDDGEDDPDLPTYKQPKDQIIT